jgi:hypothetical protein
MGEDLLYSIIIHYNPKITIKNGPIGICLTFIMRAFAAEEGGTSCMEFDLACFTKRNSVATSRVQYFRNVLDNR